MSEIVISTFKVGTGGCGRCGGYNGSDTSEFGGGRAGFAGRGIRYGVFPVIVALCSTYLLCKALSLTLSTSSL